MKFEITAKKNFVFLTSVKIYEISQFVYTH